MDVKSKRNLWEEWNICKVLKCLSINCFRLQRIKKQQQQHSNYTKEKNQTAPWLGDKNNNTSEGQMNTVRFQTR